MIETLQSLLQGFLDWLAQVILPDWNDVITWIPALLMGLVGLILLLVLAAWWRSREVNRPRLIGRVREGAPPPGTHLPGPSKWPFVIPVGAVVLFASLVLHPDRAPNPVIDPDTGQIVTGPTPDVGGLVNLPLLGLGLAVVLVGIVGWYLDARREWRRAEDPTWSAAPALEPGPEPTPPPGVHLPGPSPWPFLAPIALAVFMFGIVFSFWFVLGGLAMAIVAIAGWYRDAGREWRGTEEGHAPPHYEARSAISGRLVSLYALIAAVSLGFFFAPNYIAWVNPVPTLAPAASLSANLKITAVSVLGFDTQSLTVPADTPLTVEFDNPDAGVQHNFAIYTSSDLATALFEGERITGPAKATYQVPPIPKGTYHFVCDVHPQTMTGTLTSQ